MRDKDADTRLSCEPLRHLEATSIVAIQSTQKIRRDLLITDDRQQLSLLTRNHRLQLRMGASEGVLRGLQRVGTTAVQATCIQGDGFERQITLSTDLRTGLQLVDYILEVLQTLFKDEMSPVLSTFWRSYRATHVQSPQEALRLLGLAMAGTQESTNGHGDNCWGPISGLPDWDWLQQSASAEQGFYPLTEPVFSGMSAQHLALSLYTLHLISEERKLFVATEADVSMMAPLIFVLARSLDASDYQEIALRDGASQNNSSWSDSVPIKRRSTARVPPPFSAYINLLRRVEKRLDVQEPLHILRGLVAECLGESVEAQSTISSTLQNLRNVLELYDLFRAPHMSADPSKDSFVLSCASKGLTLEDLSDLAPAISLPLREALRQCQLNAQSSWPRRAFALLDRPDQMATATGTSSVRRLEVSCTKRPATIRQR